MWVPYNQAGSWHTHANGSTQQRHRARNEPENTADASQTGFPVLPHVLAAVRRSAALRSRDIHADKT